MNAYDGAGFAALEDGETPRGRRGCSGMRWSCFPSTPVRSSVSAPLWRRRRQATRPNPHSRTPQAPSMRSVGAAVPAKRPSRKPSWTSSRDAPNDATGALKRLVDRPEVPFAGWTIPIEPFFAPLRQRADFKEILTTLAANAR